MLLRCVTISEFIHQSPIDGHLGHFHVFAIIINTEINNLGIIVLSSFLSFCILPVYLWDVFLEVGLLSQSLNVHVILSNIAKFPSIKIVPFFTS